jgi:hypothetical protein
MRLFFKRILREPLLHFLIFGLLIYLFYNSNTHNKSQTTPILENEQNIMFPKSKFKKLQQEYAKLFDTNSSEVEEILHKQIKEKELLLQEAYKLKLYKNNPQIDAILLQKVSQIINEKEPNRETISEQELINYFKEHAATYNNRESLSYYIIHFNTLTQQEKNSLELFFNNAKEFSFAKKQEHITIKTLQNIYDPFSLTKIHNAPLKRWIGPLQTDKGYDYLYITESFGKPLSFESIENRLYRDYLYDRSKELYKKELKYLMQRYKIKEE